MAQRRVVGFVCLVVVGGAVSTGCATTVTGGEGSSQDPPAITPPGGGDGGAGGEDGVDDGCDAESGEGCVVSGCRLPFPPPATVPCEVAETATRYYVDAANGSDANAGVTPSAPWATLSHAVQNAAAGGTIRVAAGGYGSSSILVDKALIIKGGYDPTFTVWDPDVHHSSFTGAVDVHHDDAVWAGFRMITNVAAGGPTPWSQHFHTVWAGSLVRNVIGIVFTGSDETTFFQGIDSRTEVGHTTHILCNDIYMTTKGPQLWSDTVLDPDVLSGTTFIDSNRICFDEADPGNPHPTNLITGYGACVDQEHSHAYITNNILENVHQNVWSDGIEFYGCGDAAMSNNQMDIAVVNNTILVHSSGVSGYSGSDGGSVVTWRVVNNIVADPDGGGTRGIEVNYDVDPWTVLAESTGNLVFGFNDNSVFPPPVTSSGDDTSGAWSLATVFADADSGDFHLLPGGPGAGAGANVHGLPLYGGVTKDLGQAPRPPSGPWDRGALQQ
jgi:hypothetical protein